MSPVRGPGSICVVILDDAKLSGHTYIPNCNFHKNITITNNNLSNCGGAGIACVDTANLTITGNTVSNACVLTSTSAWNYYNILSATSTPAPTVTNNTCTGSASGINTNATPP